MNQPARPCPAATRMRGAALLFAATLACAGAAQAAAVACSGGAASVPVFDPAATSAELGAYTLDCGGGGPADAPFAVNVSLFLSSALLGSSAPVLNLGAASYSGTLAGTSQVNFIGVVIDPIASLLSIEHLFVDPSLQAPGTAYTGFASLSGATAVVVSDATQLLGINGEPGTVPEPAAHWLLAAAGAAWLGTRRRFSGSRT